MQSRDGAGAERRLVDKHLEMYVGGAAREMVLLEDDIAAFHDREAAEKENHRPAGYWQGVPSAQGTSSAYPSSPPMTMLDGLPTSPLRRGQLEATQLETEFGLRGQVEAADFVPAFGECDAGGPKSSHMFVGPKRKFVGTPSKVFQGLRARQRYSDPNSLWTPEQDRPASSGSVFSSDGSRRLDDSTSETLDTASDSSQAPGSMQDPRMRALKQVPEDLLSLALEPPQKDPASGTLHKLVRNSNRSSARVQRQLLLTDAACTACPLTNSC